MRWIVSLKKRWIVSLKKPMNDREFATGQSAKESVGKLQTEKQRKMKKKNKKYRGSATDLPVAKKVRKNPKN